MADASTPSLKYAGVLVGLLTLGLVGGTCARILWSEVAAESPAAFAQPAPQETGPIGAPAESFDVATALALGRTASLPVIFAAIARHHPEKAREMVEGMSSSRAKALSSVAVAKTLAADDPEAALAWTRNSLKGPVRDTALVVIANVTGGSDPVARLALLAEAGWRKTGDMYLFQERQTADTFGAVATSDVATSLLHQWAVTDADGVRTWMDGPEPTRKPRPPSLEQRSPPTQTSPSRRRRRLPKSASHGRNSPPNVSCSCPPVHSKPPPPGRLPKRGRASTPRPPAPGRIPCRRDRRKQRRSKQLGRRRGGEICWSEFAVGGVGV